MNNQDKHQGLIGHPLGHSFSPFIHEKLSNQSYELIDITLDKLKDILYNSSYHRFNVTIPYKEEVIKYLDEIDEIAKSINSVNTIVRKNNKLVGYNTDALGFLELLKYYNINLNNQNILILGTGGTKKTINYVVSKYTNSIYFATRNKTELNNNLYNYDDLHKISNKINYIINTTPIGMSPNIDQSVIDLNIFTSLNGVIDVIYNPLHTKLLLDAKQKQIPYYNGLIMLVYQAYFASNIFFNTIWDLKKVEQIYQELLLNTSSIILIGMPAVGKSTIGYELAKKLNKEFIDLDEEITKKIKKSPSEIILSEGEKEFRKIENSILKEYSQKKGIILSSGGGIVTNDDNYDLIKHHFNVIYLKRTSPLGNLDENRPVTPNLTQWQTIYNNRKKQYEKWADITINVNEDLNTSVDEIIKNIKRK